MRRRHAAVFAALIGGLLSAGAARAQDTETREIDACGVLVRVGGCILFEEGGGRYYIPDPGRYREGDAVRVIGTVDPTCITICTAADGCIRGAVLYDPAVFPCGTPLPSLANDILGSACSGLSTAISAGLLVSLWFTARRRHARRA